MDKEKENNLKQQEQQGQTGQPEQPGQPERYSLPFGEGSVLVSLEELLALAARGLQYDRLKEETEKAARQAEIDREEALRLAELFPEADAAAAKQDPAVLAYLEKGYPLTAAYAMARAENERIRRVNEEAARRSTGLPGESAMREPYYSDEQIERMSIDEVKKKLPEIMKRFYRKG